MESTQVTNGAASVLNSVIKMDEEDYNLKARKKIDRLHDFWWDKVILTMIILLLGVTTAQTIASYVQTNTAKCFVGSAEFSESVQAYIDELCMGEVPSYGRFFQIAVYAEVSLLSGLQIFWIVICNGHHESFKSAVSSMNLTRNATTGQFEASDLETVRYLERKLGSSVLFLIYIVFKLVLQFIICVTGISISFIHQLQFSESIVFKCTNTTLNSNIHWPLSNPEIYCSYGELSSIQYLRWFNVVILTIIMLAILCGVLYMCFNRYWLDYKTVARFMRHTGLRREHYVVAKTQCCYCCYPRLCTIQETKHISYDLMFQLLKLYGTNYRTAGAVFSILIENHLEYITEENCHPLKRKDKNHELADYISDVVKRCQPATASQNQPKPHGVLITHENDSPAYYIDTQIFESIICFNFNPHIINETATLCERECLFHNTPHIFQIPAYLWLWNRTKTVVCDKLEKQIEEKISDMCKGSNSERTIVFIFAPISEEFHSAYHTESRVRNFLRCARSATADKKRFTVVVHPTRIANKDVSRAFCGNDTHLPWWLSSQRGNDKYFIKKTPIDVKGVQYLLEIHTDYESIGFNIGEDYTDATKQTAGSVQDSNV